MPITDPLVLPPDVMLVPVEALAPDVRARIEAEEGDVAITRPLSRMPSSLVDGAFAELLRQFATPKTVAEAVLAYALATSADPESILTDAYPVLRRLVDCGFLVEEHAAGASAIAPTLKAGDRVAGAAVVAALQITDDGELYRVAYDDGSHGVLKLARAAATSAAEQISNEAELLPRLDGVANARLIDAGTHDGRPFVVIGWVDGVNAALAAALRRNDGLEAVRTLCVRTLEAYARLHDQGFVHADVHARNVLVGPDGHVTIVDFGVAQAVHDDDKPPYAPRPGAPTFFEPEAFGSHGMRAPTRLGEQYALGALTYLLLTGARYVDFAIERNAMFQQIALEGPVPFASRGLRPQPALELILARALAKDPAARFASVREFATALAGAPLAASATDVAADRSAVPADDGFVDRMLDRLRPGSSLYATGFLEAPTVSVTYGAAGTAYALWRIACARDDDELLALADHWYDRAARDLDSERGYVSTELGMSRDVIGDHSPYHAPSGVHAVGAFIALGNGNFGAAQRSLSTFVRTIEARAGPAELMLGRGGALLTAALLFEAVPDSSYVEAGELSRAGDALYGELFAELRALPPIADCDKVEYTGIAHGWAGILYALLCWQRVRRRGSSPELAQRLDQLAAFATPAGTGVRFRWHVADRPGGPFFMPGWCNGSPGFVHLWNLAYLMFHEPAYASLAERTAANVADSLQQGDSLCCGLAGQAYALLNMYNHSGERSWLLLAERLAVAARHAATRQSHTLMNRSESLYKGDLGVAVLLAELGDPRSARMPFFELDATAGS